MKFALFLGCFVAFSMAQYDDISILGEVLERSTGQPEGSGVEETTTETAVSSTEITSTTTEEVKTTETEAPTTTEAVTETTTETSTTTQESTTEAPSTTEATTTTETLLIPETSAPEEDIDEDSFLGFKKPDLATIYRRLFPFQHTPQRDFKI